MQSDAGKGLKGHKGHKGCFISISSGIHFIPIFQYYRIACGFFDKDRAL
jgi:hypothetical protein